MCVVVDTGCVITQSADARGGGGGYPVGIFDATREGTTVAQARGRGGQRKAAPAKKRALKLLLQPSARFICFGNCAACRCCSLFRSVTPQPQALPPIFPRYAASALQSQCHCDRGAPPPPPLNEQLHTHQHQASVPTDL